MSNLASPTEGAAVVYASSNDKNFPPESAIDGDPITYWITSGLFPQELVLSFRSMVAMDTILLRSSKIARLRVEKSDSSSLDEFQAVVEKDVDTDNDHELQIMKFELQKTTAHHVKFVILKSFDHFVSVHSIIITGTPVK